MSLWPRILLLPCVLAGFATRSIAQRDIAANEVPTTPRADELLARPVTVDFQRLSRTRAVRAVAKSADVIVQYRAQALDAYSDLVTLRATRMPLRTAIERILAGTTLRLVVDSTGQLGIVDQPGRSQQQGRGTLTGRVTDSSTRRPLAQVTVTVAGANMTGMTDANGAYTIRNIPAGEQTVVFKLLGYRQVRRRVRIDEEGSVTVSAMLAPSAAVLSEVVTTATGLQRRLEIGNDVTTLDVDSIVKTMPITNLSELLTTRVPGVVVQTTSGAPGAPSRIRIRGVTSINSSNDPIVIIDGIRAYSKQSGDATSNTAFNVTSQFSDPFLAASPIDQIDVNSLEKVEVFKGPSAVALYGTDAANGVIVITTKRGRPGPSRWSVSSDFSTEAMPKTRWPLNYWRWGTSGTDVAVHCPVIRLNSDPACLPDSLVVYQLLNDPSTSVFGRGETQAYHGEVGGGTTNLRYSLSGSMSKQVGMLKIPELDRAAIAASGMSLPNKIRRPQGDESQNATARVDMTISPRMDAAITSALTHYAQRNTPFQSAVGLAQVIGPNGEGTLLDGVTKASVPNPGSGLLSAIQPYRQIVTRSSIRATNSGTLNARVQPWLQLSTTGGIDLTASSDGARFERGDCFPAGSSVVSCTNTGMFNTGNVRNIVTTLNLRASASNQIGPWLDARTSLGANGVRTIENTITRTASGLPAGATSGNGATSQLTTERSDDRSTAGVYVETTLGLFKRLYLPLAMRRDAGSALGNRVYPVFPNISLSYLLSDEPKFRSIPVLGKLSSFRIRSAFGISGVQPGVTAKLRTYTQGVTSLNGASTATARVTGFGNSVLRPERTAELEGGVDITTANDRIVLTLTGYRKRTTDAIVPLAVAPSVDGGGSQSVNIGIVRNNGIEAQATLRIIDSRMFSWTLGVTFARNHNWLERLGLTNPLEQVTAVGTTNTIGIRYIEGYPLSGRWARPIDVYADADGDGVVSPGEIRLQDSSVYLGAPQPRYTLAVNPSVSFGRSLRVHAVFDYRNQYNELSATLSPRQSSRALNDPSVDLFTQAYFAAANGQTGIGLAQTVSSLRFNSLAINYFVPSAVTRRVLRSRQLSVGVQGKNLALWSNYRGVDPTVNSRLDEISVDNGAIPLPRTWNLSLRIN